MKTIFQIAPAVAPTVCGVGDHALLLAHHLRDSHGIETTFGVVEAAERFVLDGFQVVPLRRSANSITTLAGEYPRVLLHYANYGYQKRGCPVWLLQGLREWLAGVPGRRLVTMFHELYAHGKPWQSSFWTHPLQKAICRGTARASHGAVSNRMVSTEILRRMRGGREVCHMPVYSNIGEPEELPEFAARKRRLILFGGEGWRRKALGPDLADLKAACLRWKIEEGIEIGPGSTPDVDVGVPWRKLGPRPAAEVSEWMSTSMLGFICYTSDYLEKSGVFAAYAAHGLVPVLPNACMVLNTRGIIAGQHYVSPAYLSSEHDDALLENVSDRTFYWYQGHCSERQSSIFAKLLNTPSIG
jgi:hypothetical protein